MITAVKGTRDILPPESAVWNHVEAVAREVFRVYNYSEIRTPVFEHTSLFARGVGADTDIVGKEMYTFDDHGDSLTLRPEATASVMRAYIEHHLDQLPGPKRYYYIGPMFRRERPQKGRFRQFYQIGAEAIGVEGAAHDAEMIEMVMHFLAGLGLTGTRLLLNSVGDETCRPAFLEALKQQLSAVAPRMCKDCQRRAVTNPLRVFDCKVPEDQPIIATLPSIADHLCGSCSHHFETVKRRLKERGILFEVNPRLVRGLDYYMRTTFEVVHGDLGAQSAVLGGGRYDGLAQSLGSSLPTPGIGFSLGEDRLVMLLGKSVEPAQLDLYVFFIAKGDPTAYLAKEVRQLREQGLSVEVGVFPRVNRGLEMANKLRARFVLIVGEDEIQSETYSLKDMASGEQVKLKAPDIAARIRSKH